jgi:hypothetical protein
MASGAVAQLGERVLCKHEVTGSIPVSSTKSYSLFPGCRHDDVTATQKQVRESERVSRASGLGFLGERGSADF